MVKRRGFTLMEVMVAVMILAVALPALIKSVGSNLNNVSHLKEKTVAEWVALNRITELQATHAWPDVGLSNGTDTQAGIEWRWQIKISETPEKDMRRVDVEVRLRQKDKNPIASLQGYLGKPV